jgi:carboxyl-terminal processing protease
LKIIFHIAKGLVIWVLFLAVRPNLQAQINTSAILDSVIAKSREVSMYSTSVDWDSLSSVVQIKGKEAKTIEELKPAFESLLNGMRDHHGRIIDAKTYQPIAHFTDFKNIRHKDSREFDQKIWSIVNDTALKFEHCLLPGNIAYLKIVGIGPMVNVEKEAKKIRKAVDFYVKKKIENWIIDLRYNGGGNMHPMMAGLGPLIGDGLVGKLVDFNGNRLFDWEIKAGNFIYDDYQLLDLKNKTKFKKLPRVAVLTSRWTVSSGELVATAFKGRNNTRFFGEATGGYASNTGWEIIDDEVIVSISTGIYCDRNGRSYTINLPVDEEIQFEVITNKSEDPGILRAMHWLTQN